jgi:cell wall-associated NlpC family hydrolase
LSWPLSTHRLTILRWPAAGRLAAATRGRRAPWRHGAECYLVVLCLVAVVVVGLLQAGCAAPKRVVRRTAGVHFQEVGAGSGRASAAGVTGALTGNVNVGLMAATLALEQIGTPYRYGGHGTSGFDCSGLMMYVFRRQGIKLPRRARDQARVGQAVARKDLQPGDLLFFQADGHEIDHVGIYAGKGEFIHAPGRGRSVCKESLAQSWWSRHWVAARRVY